jgi:hypothetical protein
MLQPRRVLGIRPLKQLLVDPGGLADWRVGETVAERLCAITPTRDGMMIVPVGEKERETIVRESSILVGQVERAPGYRPRQ